MNSPFQWTKQSFCQLYEQFNNTTIGMLLRVIHTKLMKRSTNFEKLVSKTCVSLPLVLLSSKCKTTEKFKVYKQFYKNVTPYLLYAVSCARHCKRFKNYGQSCPSSACSHRKTCTVWTFFAFHFCSISHSKNSELSLNEVPFGKNAFIELFSFHYPAPDIFLLKNAFWLAPMAS